MSTAIERQIKPIYDALDTNSPKSAIVSCNKLLKKYPKSELIKALKALALLRLGKIEDCLVVCDDVLVQKPTDDAVLTALSLVLRGLGRNQELMAMFEEAYKGQPQNEELGQQTFFSNTRAQHWKNAQMTANKLFKQFQNPKYLYWSITSTLMQARDSTTPPEMKTMLYKLAARLISTAPSPSTDSADKFHLHLTILREVDLDEACKHLDTPTAQLIYNNNLAVDELRRDIWAKKGMLKEEGDLARTRISENHDRNWLEFKSLLDAAFAPLAGDAEPSEEARSQCTENVEDIREFLENIKREDGRRDRSASLALVDLAHRERKHGLSKNADRLLDLLQDYVKQMGGKATCFEDVTRFLDFEGADLERWTAFLQERANVVVSQETPTELMKYINVQKLLRYNLSAITVDSEVDAANALLAQYLAALKLADDLKEGELHPADDLAILAASAFVSAWSLQEGEEKEGNGGLVYLYRAAMVLEYALTRSKHAYSMRLMVIQIHRLLAAPTPALEHYRALRVKQIQNDTLSHMVLSRASAFSLSGSGDLTFLSECIEANQIYVSNTQDTADYTGRAFLLEKYSQIPGFVDFEDQLECSLHREILKVEHTRMRYCHEIISEDVVDLELIELKAGFDRYQHDNRDFDIIPNYQPKGQPSYYKQTRLFSIDQERNWLRTMMDMYVNALTHASNLDDTVEEKLLIGDRQRPNANTTDRPSLRNWPSEPLAELTPAEAALKDFSDALSEWMKPYHDHARPPPAVVLAEAAKQAALKGGQPLKGIDLAPATNGSAKKDPAEAPAVKDAPESLNVFFDDIKVKLAETFPGRKRAEALHIAGLAQEALLFIVIESLRWKNPTNVKTHKFGALVQHLKAIRAHAIAALKAMAADLQKFAQEEDVSQRKLIQEACAPLPLDHDFMLDVAKKVTDSRKKVIEGVAKGMIKLCSNYNNLL